MKSRILFVPVLCVFACVCFGAPQAANDSNHDEAERFSVLRTGHLVAPSEALTNAEAKCSITNAEGVATMKCRPLGVTVKSSYHYHTALVVDAQGTGYVIACRNSLVANFWCKGFAPGEVLEGSMAKGQLAVVDGEKTRNYFVLVSAYVGTPAAIQLPPSKSKAPARFEPSHALAAVPPASGTQVSSAQEKPKTSADPSAICMSYTGACVTFVSDPQGADIYVDGKFVGNTPSMLALAAGSHELRLQADKFNAWTRTFEASAGSKVTVRATLTAQPPDH